MSRLAYLLYLRPLFDLKPRIPIRNQFRSSATESEPFSRNMAGKILPVVWKVLNVTGLSLGAARPQSYDISPDTIVDEDTTKLPSPALRPMILEDSLSRCFPMVPPERV